MQWKKKELIDNNNLLSEEKKAANDIYLVRVVVLCKYLCKTEKLCLVIVVFPLNFIMYDSYTCKKREKTAFSYKTRNYNVDDNESKTVAN